MIERKWQAATAVLTAFGSSQGSALVDSPLGLHVKATVKLSQAPLPDILLEIKRVNSPTSLELGPPGHIDSRFDLSAYSAGAVVFAPIQPRPDIPLKDIDRATYEEEPAVARRSLSVDRWGRPYTADNPLPVQLSDGSINIGTLNANLETQLTARDNDPKPGDVHDSVRVGDGSNELAINPNGSVNVVLASGGVEKSFYDEAAAVPSGADQLLTTYTVPPGKLARLRVIQATGDNIALYSLLINGAVADRKRSYFGGALNVDFLFGDGLPLVAGDAVTVRVTHARPDPADFGARIQVTEI